MSYKVKRSEAGWELHHDDKVVRTYPTREAARWNAKRFGKAEAETSLFFKVYRELFG